tara:strand:- start:2258 stop:2689 length:432 start_codon:yes stop_codon:yes gene_type:complete
MKNIKAILVALAFSVLPAMAEDIPAFLKDSEITVTLKNGKTYKFSGNEYKVVKRGSKAKLETQLPGHNVVVINPARKRNRLTVHGGIGFDGLSTANSSNSVQVKQAKEPVFGLSLSRDFDYDFSLSATVLTNQTYLLGVGQDF